MREITGVISVITVSFNSAPRLRSLLQSLDTVRREGGVPVEAIVVNNASRDETAQMVAQEFAWCRLVESGGNIGFAGGCNAGLRVATGSHLILLNPDCIANAAALRGMAEFLDIHREVGGVGCRLLHEDGLPQRTVFDDVSASSYWIEHSLVSPFIESFQKHTHSGRQWASRPLTVDALMGACLMVRRDVYERVGGLEESYFLYSEDTDWCRRIRNAGFTLVYLPKIQMSHSQRDSAHRLPEYCFRRLYRSLLEYSRRFNNAAIQAGLRRAVIVDMTIRRPLYAVLDLFRPGSRTQRRASLARILDAYRADDPMLLDEPVPTS